MRLGDVIESTERADEQPAPPRRRTRLWVTLWLAVGLAAVSLVHGPIVLFPAEGEVIVLYTARHLSVLGPETRVINDKPFAIRVPLAQNFARLEIAARESAFEVDVGAAGTRVRLVGGVARHQVRPADAEAVIQRLGVAPEARDQLIEALARKTHASAIADLDLGALADARQIERALIEAGRALADEAANYGVEVEVTTRPAASLDPEVSRLLARIGEAEDRIAGQRSSADKQGIDRAEVTAALQRRHRAEQAAVESELADRRAKARQAVEAARLRAEQVYTERISSARSEAATLLARARVIESNATAEATAIRARMTAIGDRGPQVLDHVIATHVMPQLSRLRTGMPAAQPVRWAAPPPTRPPAVATEPAAPPMLVGPPAPEGAR